MKTRTFAGDVSRGIRFAGVVVAMTVLTATSAGAQAISGHAGSTAGSTANSGDTSGTVRSSRNTEVSTATQFRSRFAWNLSSDVGIFTTRDSNGSAQHNMSFNVTAPGGYRLDISESRQGIMQRANDASGCNGAADVSALTGSQGGGTLTSGSLSLADPGGIGNGGSTTNTVINQTTNAAIHAVSNGGSIPHTLTFTWNGTTRSNSCEAAVRLGEGSSVTGCSACVYPGSPSRTQSTDGHFVTVDLVNLCGNGVIDNVPPVVEQCDTAIAGSVCCASNCQFASNATVCRASAGICDVAENCTGSSASCPANAFAASTTVCRAGAGICDVAETCTGSSAPCPADTLATTAIVCRAVAGICDVAENCTGSSVNCPADSFLSNATVCRAVAGVCDVAENCTGSSAPCPADAFLNNTTVCRASAGVCDLVDNCTGSSAPCPPDAKSVAVCRGVADICDTAESCDGVNDNCPADGFLGTATVCRSSAGVCDIAENCTGSGAACPGDTREPNTTQCRGLADICDVAENCDGSGVACPADAFESTSVVCRGVADVCDVSESCTGTGPSCPADSFQSSAVVCRPSVDVCDTTDNCPGNAAACSADAREPVTTVCRPAVSTADAPENCDAVNTFCPADAFFPAGTPCDDGDFCTQLDEADGFGVCLGLDPVDCDDVNPCTDDVCDSQMGGFLCQYTNNGTCVSPNCGNFVVDAGETCDPPNLAINPQTNQIECRLDCTSCGDGVIQTNNVETCDDGNIISGCRTDKPQLALDGCLNNCNEPICSDPAQIRFGAEGKRDSFSFHGRLIADVPDFPIDFVNNHFVMELRTLNGDVVFRTSLVRGSVEVKTPTQVRYKNRGARAGGGVYKVEAKAGKGYYILTLKAYGDLSASIADMTTHVYVGSDEWALRGKWIQQGTKGWRLSNKDTFLPVP